MTESKNLPPSAIRINLGTEDFEKSIKFYTTLGFVQNKKWPYDQIVAFCFPKPNNNLGLVIAHKGAHFRIYIRCFADHDGHMWEDIADIDGAVASDDQWPQGYRC